MQDKKNLTEVEIENQHIIDNTELNIWEALIPVLVLMLMLAANIKFFDGEALGEYSNQFILLIAGFIALAAALTFPILTNLIALFTDFF